MKTELWWWCTCSKFFLLLFYIFCVYILGTWDSFPGRLGPLPFLGLFVCMHHIYILYLSIFYYFVRGPQYTQHKIKMEFSRWSSDNQNSGYFFQGDKRRNFPCQHIDNFRHRLTEDRRGLMSSYRSSGKVDKVLRIHFFWKVEEK